MEEVVISVKDEPLAPQRCAACFENTKNVFQSDCKCFDLNLCEHCWVEWISANNYDRVNDMLLCPKCATAAFTVEPNHDDRVPKYFANFLLGIFAMIALALIIFANITLL